MEDTGIEMLRLTNENDMETRIPEHELIERLREVTDAARHQEPSAGVEARLMRAFGERRTVDIARPERRIYWPLAAAAAIVVVALTPLVMLRMGGALPSPAGSIGSTEPAQAGTLDGFVPVPGAASLPRLESASIVRYQLPLAALPVYGVDVVADPGRHAVEADLLIGQDGHARAIRIAER